MSPSVGGANTLLGLGDLEAGRLAWVPFTCLAGFQQRSWFSSGYLSLTGFSGNFVDLVLLHVVGSAQA
jgi:hypothetical protein